MKRFKISVDGVAYNVTVEELEKDGTESLSDSKVKSSPKEKTVAQKLAPASVATPATSAQTTGAGDGIVQSPLSGTIIEVRVKAGETVKSGTPLLSLEAMKMESEIIAPIDGRVQSIEVTAGQSVQEGQVLLTLTKV
jgi:biotin carboxyl carrier protein